MQIPNKKIICAALIAIAVIISCAAGYFIGHRKNTYDYKALQALYLSSQDRLTQLSKERASALTETAKTEKEIQNTQKKNDKQVEEVKKNAIKKSFAISDSDTVNELNSIIASARQSIK